MKRSKINTIITQSIAYLNTSKFYLPEWAYWTYDIWQRNKEYCKEIFSYAMGWDVTDSGGSFEKNGMVLFTIRNGLPNTDTHPYCEKIIIMQSEQVCPYHYHKTKIEDIINRGNGTLGFRLLQVNTENEITQDDVVVSVDGMYKTLAPKEEFVLQPGQSITLPQYCAHMFYPKDENVLIGEVSTVNDDNTDNYFLDEVSRFPTVEEDEK